jgi:N4-(beta-N-acetylglucosaminyl)-L-asparaginase
MRIGYAVSLEMSLEGLIDANHLWGTISCSAVGPRGDICGVTTTSGLAFKIPGRIGDSPILGAGSTCGTMSAPPDRPAAASRISTAVQLRSRPRDAAGLSPKDACMAALREIHDATVDPSC